MAKKTELEKRLEEVDALHRKGVISDEEHQARRAAVLASPAVQQQATGKKGFPIFRVGCLGIIVLVVVVIIIAIVANGGGGDDSAQPGQVGTNKGDVHVDFAANASGTIAPEGNGNKKQKITILQSADNVTSKNQFAKPAAGKKWWGVEVVIENAGSAEVTSLDWKLRDSKDIEHDDTIVVGAGETLDMAYTLTPGGKKQGWVYFEIDADATPKWLRADPNPFLKNDLYFDVK